MVSYLLKAAQIILRNLSYLRNYQNFFKTFLLQTTYFLQEIRQYLSRIYYLKVHSKVWDSFWHLKAL